MNPAKTAKENSKKCWIHFTDAFYASSLSYFLLVASHVNQESSGNSDQKELKDEDAERNQEPLPRVLRFLGPVTRLMMKARGISGETVNAYDRIENDSSKDKRKPSQEES